ncbi:MAG: hypothetical protein NZ957_02265 [Thaumarchaeota archaeon]|nr:hypothetical protein [Candidatus Calditenuaceae archaeon]
MAKVLRAASGLTDRHFNVLRAVERSSVRGKLARVESVARAVKLSEGYVEKLLGDLHDASLVWSPMGRRSGYLLTYAGLDALALGVMLRRGIIASVGGEIGVGKESDVYVADTPEGERVSLKLYRAGRVSMTKYRRTRDVPSELGSYLAASTRFAANEVHALRILSGAGLPVPLPVYRNRHAVVAQLIDGRMLVKARSLPRSPEIILEELLRAVRDAYLAGVIHRDLSAYNVLIDSEGRPWIIDWPQWVSRDHPNGLFYFRRDVSNLVDFFARRYHVEIPPSLVEEFLKSVTQA